MRTLDGASVSVEASGELTRLVISAPTGEQFLVELGAEAAATLAAALTTEHPAPDVPDTPATAIKE